MSRMSRVDNNLIVHDLLINYLHLKKEPVQDQLLTGVLKISWVFQEDISGGGLLDLSFW